MATERVSAGPGIIREGIHIEYLPAFRPGPRSNPCHGGTILSIGTKTVRWRPYNWHCAVRTCLEAMRIAAERHLDTDQTPPRTGRPTPQWRVWSLAQHRDYAAAHNAPIKAPAHCEDGETLPDEQRPLLVPGIIEPGWHIEYLPAHRPGPHTRHAYGGVIVSIGPKAVRWRPHDSDTDVRTPLEHMRISTAHIPAHITVTNTLAGGPPTKWYAWSLAQHLAYAAEHASPEMEETTVPAATEPSAEDEQLALAPPRRRARLAQHPAAGPVVVVPCGSAKLNYPALAGDLYTGSYHLACRRAAEALTASGGTVLILSAAHGFVSLDEPLGPYERRMGQPGSVQLDTLRAQANQLGLHHGSHLIALGGRAYVNAVAAVRPDALLPLTGCRGIGEQRARLSRIAAAEHPLRLVEELVGIRRR
ncbi:DUF6884 domain-containing protein [Streptomyces mordarskii]|uniref:DUF6884 domain-containing protein n=1 Tax=Streptomyces mordarskii TaxID=1226758 RepID=A0ABN1EUC3_9ACTN